MQSKDVRQKYIDYFAKNGHQAVASSRLIPENDPTLLFTNAGMNQFKNLFLGLEQRDYKRAVSSQKCVRAGGKHNDLENVGHTARHHTFFEMLGNFSFGDYFKKDAIHFAWELITKEFQVDKNRLYVSVYKDDDEAADIWHKQEGVPKDRIYRFDQDNFWRMGDSGPCGPCSEIFYDLGPEVPGDPKDNVMGGNGDRYMEFWNLVFMQFEEDGKGGRTNLPKPSVDTGMGLERMTNIMQGKINNYDTDLFQDLIAVASKISGAAYASTAKLSGPARTKQEEINVALRVLADHARASAFLIADGVLPSNEGRGYVLRRIMRRAIRYGRQLSDESILPSVVDAVVKKMSGFYGELNQQKVLLERTVVDEEKRFLATLDQGTHVLTQELANLKSGGTLGGEVLFKLYDTFGFPVDLTRLMANEKGFKIDEAGFEKHLEAAKEKARASWKGKGITSDQAHMVQFTQRLHKQSGDTVFTGYDTSTERDAKLLALSDGKQAVQEIRVDQTGIAAFDKTPFYAEGGGPIGDRGIIKSPNGEAEVLDTTKQNGIYLHQIKVTDGVFKIHDPLQLIVTSHERRNTANNHSATHLLHAALRMVLGTHVQQAGSLVEPDRLRFDFTHNQPMTQLEIEKVESLVNDEVAKSIPVKSAIMPHDQAMKAGAMALFGEKYGDNVRVITMGDFSVELCGGIHVGNTSQIRLFKIVSEGGVSAGVRRIEAITGDRATEYVMGFTREALQARAQAGLPAIPSPGATLPLWISQAQTEKKDLLKEIQALKGKGVDVDSIVSSAKPFSRDGVSGQFIFADVQVDDRKVLSELSDRLQDRLKGGVVVILGQGDGSHPLIVSVSKTLTGKLNAGKILGEVAQTLGGKGGGRPDFAQGAVPSRKELNEAQMKVQSLLN